MVTSREDRRPGQKPNFLPLGSISNSGSFPFDFSSFTVSIPYLFQNPTIFLFLATVILFSLLTLHSSTFRMQTVLNEDQLQSYTKEKVYFIQHMLCEEIQVDLKKW